jgi:hypothetical protein
MRLNSADFRTSTGNLQDRFKRTANETLKLTGKHGMATEPVKPVTQQGGTI